MKKIALLGCNGQLGEEVQATVPGEYELFCYSRQDIDIRDQQQLAKLFIKPPDVVINASAYTAVDQAETEQDMAYSVNARAMEEIGRLCSQANSRLIHVSTDFVFDGNQQRAYKPSDKPNPESVYGASKLKGEQLLATIAGLDYLIIRTSWVHSAKGNNFVKTMLRLFQERDTLSVVNDQTGSPTWAHNLADIIWAFIEQPDKQGIYHYTDAGFTSWYEFACAIQDESIIAGWPDNNTSITAIPSSSYPTPAKRPSYSVLDCQTTEQALNITRQPWREALRSMLQELKTQQ